MALGRADSEGRMVTVSTRISSIHWVEGFDIELLNKRTGRRISERRQGVLGPYAYRAKLADKKTVADWITKRFEPTYPELSCNVLDGRGFAADPEETLENVRASYFWSEQ